MKNFITLFSDLFSGPSNYKTNASSGSRQRPQNKGKSLLFGFSTKVFHKNRVGEPGNTKSVFLLMLIGFFGIIAGCIVLIINPYDVIFKFKSNFNNRGEMYELWKTPPVSLYLKVYLFNITNREAFLEGREKLKLQEVGPYVYREGMEHLNVSFNNNGTLTAVPHHPLKWVPDLSAGSEDDVLVLPNIALLSFANLLVGKPYFTQLAVNLLIRQTNSHPIVEMTAREFMFEYKSSLVTLGNKVLPGWIMFNKLGLIDRMYDFSGDVSTFYTGENDISRTGLFATYNRSPKLPHWNLPCGNVQNSSDGTKFPSFIKPNDSLLFYRKSLCRAIPLVRDGNEEIYRNGLRGYKYIFKENSLDNGAFNRENKCFCRKGKCFRRGLIDVTDCYYGFPIAVSYPHFYLGDPSLVEEIEGSHPDRKKHETYFIIEPETGLPLEVAVRTQINLASGDLTPMARVGQFKHLVLPLVWTEIGMYGLPQDMNNLFKMYLNILPAVQNIFLYVSFIGGIGFFLVAVIKLLRSGFVDSVTIRSEKISRDEKETKVKSPIFSSRNVIAEIIDEGKQVIFGSKSHKPKSNTVYRDTTRRKSSLSEMFALVGRDSKQKKGKTKSEIYEGTKSQIDSTETKLLKSSSDSDTESGSEKKQSDENDPFSGEDNQNFSETEKNLSKLLSKKKTESEIDQSKDLDNFEVDIRMLDSLKEDVV